MFSGNGVCICPPAISKALGAAGSGGETVMIPVASSSPHENPQRAMFSSCNVARLRTNLRTKATRIMTIVCMLQTVAGSGLKCQNFCGRRGFEERQPDLQVHVRDNNVDQALRVLKKKMLREGLFREMKLRNGTVRLKFWALSNRLIVAGNHRISARFMGSRESHFQPNCR